MIFNLVNVVDFASGMNWYNNIWLASVEVLSCSYAAFVPYLKFSQSDNLSSCIIFQLFTKGEVKIVK